MLFIPLSFNFSDISEIADERLWQGKLRQATRDATAAGSVGKMAADGQTTEVTKLSWRGQNCVDLLQQSVSALSGHHWLVVSVKQLRVAAQVIPGR